MRIIAALLLATLARAFRAFVYQRLWAWFLVPHLHFPALTFMGAVWVSIIFEVLVRDPSTAEIPKLEYWRRALRDAVLSGIAIGLGWIVYICLR